MTARAEASIFWPGITKDITATRDRCATCNSNAPSQPAMPSITPEEPLYPFQHVAADFFHHQGITYLVIVDRYTNWPVVTPSREGATGLIQTLRETFSTFGIPDTLTSDGGPEFASHTTRLFLSNWGVHHRTASAYHPHANCRAEVAVKTMKRLIAGNTGPGGTLTDKFHKALLQYRNSPDPETRMSPAACLFGRPTRDLLPGIPKQYRPHTEWTDRLDLRERALTKRSITNRTRWDEHSQGLSPLKCGDTVMVQNQTGRHPNKWDKTGTVVEVLQYHQYAVRTDGSGRLTTRNRRFLRRYHPIHPSPPTNMPSFPLPQPPPIQTHYDVQPTAPTTTTPPQPEANVKPPVITPTSPAQPGTPQDVPAIAQPSMITPTSPITPGPPQDIPIHSARPLLPQTPASLPRPCPRSYATVTSTPLTPRMAPSTPPRPTKPTGPKTLLPTPTSPIPLRRSKRGPKPVLRYGSTNQT